MSHDSTARLLSYAETANRLGVPVGTLYAMVSQRTIPHIRIGRRLVRFSGEAIDKWVAERTVNACAR